MLLMRHMSCNVPAAASYLLPVGPQVVVNAPVSAEGLGVATTSLIYERTIQS